MSGVYLVNKEEGMTSFDVIARLRKILKIKKIGHSGTLDPQASGLLLVLTGKYTKFIPYCVQNNKHYVARFELGKASDTEDIWGNIIATKKSNIHQQKELDEVAKQFKEIYYQTPPMYSAKKKDGKKFYEYARSGITFEREPIKVEIKQLKVKCLGANCYEMDAIVSKGTYMRTLIVDFAKRLHELACMTSLKRVSIEHLTLDQAINIADFKENTPSLQIEACIDPIYPLVAVNNPKDIYDGKKMIIDNDEDVVLLTYEGKILAAYKKESTNLYHSLRGLF